MKCASVVVPEDDKFVHDRIDVSDEQCEALMDFMLTRIILYVQDVERLRAFYCDMFGLRLRDHFRGEWAVLDAGPCELALHRVGAAYRVPDPSSWQADSNAKIVLSSREDLDELRARLVAKGVRIGDIKEYPGTGRLCDGRDPEGNVFQLAEGRRAADIRPN